MTFFRLLYKKTLSSSLKQKRKAAKQVKGKYYVLSGRHLHGCLASSCALISEKTMTRTGVGQNGEKISRKEKNIIMETHFCLAQFILVVLRPFPSLKLFSFLSLSCFSSPLPAFNSNLREDETMTTTTLMGKLRIREWRVSIAAASFDAAESPFRHFKISTSNRTFVPATHTHLHTELFVVVVIFSFQTPRRLTVGES